MIDLKKNKTDEKTKKRRPDSTREVVLRNDFYWAQYRNLIGVNIIALVSLIVGIAILMYFVTFTPPHKYIATTTDFKVLTSPPLNEEYLGEGDVIQVATNAMRGAYNYDYINYQDQITSAQKWFTIVGWNAFLAELQESGALDSVKLRKQVVSLNIMEAPFIKEKGLVNGIHSWVVEFPRVQVTYYGQTGNKMALTFFYKFRVEVARTHLDYSIKGAAVNALRAKDASTGKDIARQ